MAWNSRTKGIPGALTDRYGAPETITSRWASFFHRCPAEASMGRGQYPMLLYNIESGWLICKACGHKAKAASGSAVPPQKPISAEEAANGTSWIRESGKLASQLVGQPPLRSRTEREIEEHRIVVSGQMPDYLIFPITHNGLAVSWHARDIREETWRLSDRDREVGPGPVRKRWLSPSATDLGWSRRSCLWGYDRIEPNDVVFLCEGIFDALYFDTGVAYMGPVPTETQVMQVLDKRPRAIVICSDKDMDPEIIRRAVRSKDRYVPVVVPGEPDELGVLPGPVPQLGEKVSYRRADESVWTEVIKDYGGRFGAGLRFVDFTEIPVDLVGSGDLWWMDM